MAGECKAREDGGLVSSRSIFGQLPTVLVLKWIGQRSVRLTWGRVLALCRVVLYSMIVASPAFGRSMQGGVPQNTTRSYSFGEVLFQM
jgi:hypothetical protein